MWWSDVDTGDITFCPLSSSSRIRLMIQKAKCPTDCLLPRQTVRPCRTCRRRTASASTSTARLSSLTARPSSTRPQVMCVIYGSSSLSINNHWAAYQVIHSAANYRLCHSAVRAGGIRSGCVVWYRIQMKCLAPCALINTWWGSGGLKVREASLWLESRWFIFLGPEG